ncbi:lsk1 [Acrasis kona]|uniref:Lsk1 n=1 Tax=Acrasis kona TaxID=1008807 RepID=A0AAW2Z7T4_9EUKA
MKALILLITLSFFVLSSCYVDFQGHSVNDLREWPQLLAKGMVWSKVDMNYIPNSLCKQLPSTYPANIREDPRGCFLLTHDLPYVKNPSYNTTQNLLDMISSPNLAKHFRRKDHKFHLALCFKHGGNCKDEGWMSLVDEFYNHAQSLSTKIKDLEVEYILDGSGTPNKDCLYNKWRPWLSTYIPGQDPVDAYESNNNATAYDRYQILNPSVDKDDPQKNIQQLIKSNYGKFINSNHPFLTWEPSNQSDILKVIQSYNNGPQNKNGLYFAINIDPHQFDIYSRSNRSWNVPSTIPQHKPFITSVGLHNGETHFLNLYRPCETCRQIHYSVYTTTKVLGDLKVIKHLELKFPHHSHLIGTIRDIRIITRTRDECKLLLASNNYELVFLNYNYMSHDLVLVSKFENNKSVLDANVFLYQYKIYVSTLEVAPNCSLLLRVSIFHPYKVIQELCLMTQDRDLIRGASMDVITHDDRVSAVVFASDASLNVWSCVVEKFFSKVICSQSPVDVGSHPSVSLSVQNDTIKFLQVHTNSFCYNSDFKNRQSMIAVCEYKPKSIKNVLAYNYGDLDALVNHISHNKSTITSCDEHIFHGTYDMGSNPVVHLYRDGNGELGVVSVHEGVTDGVEVDGECGAPLVYSAGTSVIDSWRLAK